MKNIDYDSILSGFQRKRLENEILADNRKAEIYEKIPEIKRSIRRSLPLLFRQQETEYENCLLIWKTSTRIIGNWQLIKKLF